LRARIYGARLDGEGVSGGGILEDRGESPVFTIEAMAATHHIDFAVGRVSHSGITFDLERVSTWSGREGDGWEGSDGAPRTCDVVRLRAHFRGSGIGGGEPLGSSHGEQHH